MNLKWHLKKNGKQEEFLLLQQKFHMMFEASGTIKVGGKFSIYVCLYVEKIYISLRHYANILGKILAQTWNKLFWDK